MGLLIGSHLLLWILVLLEGVVIFVLARQVGLLHERIAPMGALVTDNGPKAGEIAPLFNSPTLQGGAVTIGGARASGKDMLLLFVAPTCPVCKKIIPIARRVALSEKLDLVFVGDGDQSAQQEMVDRLHMKDFPFVNSPEIGLKFHVGKLPYGILLGADGRIVSKGLVNSREHLESLTMVAETGYSSIQQYLRANQTNTAEEI